MIRIDRACLIKRKIFNLFHNYPQLNCMKGDYSNIKSRTINLNPITRSQCFSMRRWCEMWLCARQWWCVSFVEDIRSSEWCLKWWVCCVIWVQRNSGHTTQYVCAQRRFWFLTRFSSIVLRFALQRSRGDKHEIESVPRNVCERADAYFRVEPFTYIRIHKHT